ncbi:MAG: terminase [Polynucleobacter sp.]|nr:terminase [Polynucleobacter sp.]
MSEGEPLRAICRDEHMPSWMSVYRWLESNEGFSLRIARARELGEQALAEQCLDIADDEQHDWALTKKGVIVNDVAIGRAKLQVETRLKLLAKFNPKKWGDSNKLELSGHLALGNMTDEEIRAELAAFAALGIVPPTNDDDDISDLL